MRAFYSVLLLFALIQAVAFAVDTTSVRIDGNKVVVGSVSTVIVPVYYNKPLTGLPATSVDLQNFITGSLNGSGFSFNSNPATYNADLNAFNVILSSTLLAGSPTTFPPGSYSLQITLRDNFASDGSVKEVAFTDNNVFTVVERKAVPETNEIVVALFVILALLAMRMHFASRKKKTARKR